MPTPRPSKICPACGRSFAWRKKWERSWDQVVYCSKRCRSTKLSATDLALEAAILDLLRRRAGGATICPSEAARAVAQQPLAATGRNADSREPWRELMEPARAAARRLVASGHVVITQRGREVDPSTARGPIRIRASRSS